MVQTLIQTFWLYILEVHIVEKDQLNNFTDRDIHQKLNNANG